MSKQLRDVNNLQAVMFELAEYIDSCTKDKYNSDNDDGLDTGADLLGKDSAAINGFQIKKYLKRYMTTGFKKSKLRSDLFKIIHYTLFELEATREIILLKEALSPEDFASIKRGMEDVKGGRVKPLEDIVTVEIKKNPCMHPITDWIGMTLKCRDCKAILNTKPLPTGEQK